jgi:hypothetical protein
MHLTRLKARKAGSVHRRSYRRGRTWLLFVFLGAASVISWEFAHQQPSLYEVPSTSDGPSASLDGNHGSSFQWSRLSEPAFSTRTAAYPYSVIPGGVSSPEELRRAAEQDPVVSRHFQGFNFDRAHLLRLSEKQSRYVSYRIGDRIYWTRRKVSLYAGEILISDGSILARTRCGNRVALAPLDAGSPLEPSLEELEAPPIRSDPGLPPSASPTLTLAKLPDSLPANQKGGHFWFIPPVYVPPGSSRSSPEPLAVTPEPGSALLICSGFAGVFWRFRKNRRNN